MGKIRIWQKKYFVFWVIAAGFILTGCGGGSGGEGSTLPAERPHVVTSGYGVDAIIVGGTVTAYGWENGVKGNVFGSDVTDENGHYSIPIQAKPQPVLLELTGGTYVEEASGKEITLKDGQYLYAVINYGGDEISVMITPFTTLAVGLTEYYVSSGDNVENAITKAHSEITGITVFNILSEYPVNITQDANRTDELTDGHMYGFFCAALSSWTAELSEENGTGVHDVYTSIYLTQLMYRDVKHDGVLEGYGIAQNDRPGNITVGTVQLDSQLYRLKIGYHILRAADADYNASGLIIDDVLEQAHIFSQRVNALFGLIDPLPLDNEGPMVYQTEPMGKQYRGQVQYGFKIEDPVGINSMEVSVDGNLLEYESPQGTEADVVVTIDTTRYIDGDHIFQVVSTDKLGNESTHEQPLYINNSGVIINVDELPSLTNVAAVEVTGTYESTGTEISIITVNGKEALVQRQNQTWSSQITLESGVNEIIIVATDTIGNEVSVIRTVECDRTAPEITTGDDHGYHRFYIGRDQITSLVMHDENTGDPLYFNYENISLNGIAVNRADLKSAEIPFFIFTVNDPEDNGIFTNDADLSVSMTYHRDGQELSTRTLQSLPNTSNEYIIPLVTEYLSDDFYQTDEEIIHSIRVRVADSVGNASSKILTFKVYVDANELTIQSLNDQSDVAVYAFDTGTKGGLIAQTTTDANGAAVLKMFTHARPLLIELTGGEHKEIGTGRQVQLTEDQSLQAVVNYVDQDITVNVTALTTVAAAKAKQSKDAFSTVQETVSAANAYVSNIYGVDVVNAGIVDISDNNNATNDCTEAYQHSFVLAGLSKWTLNAANDNGASSQQHYNSVLLAQKMSADISDDGELNGGQEFGTVLLDAQAYQTGFGSATIEAIESDNNNTNLGVGHYIGTSISAADAQEESQVLGAPFNQRSSTINRELLSATYTLANTGNQALFVEVKSIGQQHNLRHEYFDSVRKHLIRRDRQIQYRGRVAGGYLSLNLQTDPISWTVENSYYDWQTISRYQVWENNRWNQINLSPTESTTIEHNSDQLPANQHIEWEYFISEPGGNVKNRMDNPEILYRLAGGLVPGMPLYEIIYDYWLDEIENPMRVDFPSEDISHTQYFGAALRILKVYNGPYHTDGTANYLEGDDFNYLTRNIDEAVTPEIQRDYTETFATVDAPHNEISEEYSQDHPFQSSRYTVDNGVVGQVETVMGYYAIQPGGAIYIKKHTTTPNIQLYSDGEPNYTPATYDRSLAWSIDKDITVSVRRGDINNINQTPVFELTHSGNQTYTMTR